MSEQVNHSEEFMLGPEHYAAIYARKSNLGKSNSKESQIDLAKEVLLEKGLLPYDVYDEDASATKYKSDTRAQFKRLMQDAEAGRFKNIIVFRSDRLARDAEDFIKIRKFCRRLGIKILYSSQNGYELPSDYMGHFMENMIMAVDQLEPQMIAERIAIGKKKQRERGRYMSGGNVPFGYIRNPDLTGSSKSNNENNDKTISISNDAQGSNQSKKSNKEYIHLDSEASIIKTIFEECLFIGSKYTIDNFTSVIYKKHHRKISLSTIDRYIRNSIYGGYLILDTRNTIEDVIIMENKSAEPTIDFKKLRECNNIEAIVNKDIYFKALIKWLEVYQKTSKAISEDSLFDGLIYCETCNKLLSLSDGQYSCTKKDCTCIDSKELHSMIFSKLVDDLISNKRREQLILDRITKLNKECTLIQNRIKKSYSKQSMAFEDFINSPQNQEHKKIFLEFASTRKGFMEDIDSKEKMLYNLNQLLCRIRYLKENQYDTVKLNSLLLEDENIIKEFIFPIINKIIIRGEHSDERTQINYS